MKSLRLYFRKKDMRISFEKMWAHVKEAVGRNLRIGEIAAYDMNTTI